MIDVESLTRVFRTYKKQPGFWGGVKGLFRREFEEIRAARLKEALAAFNADGGV